MTPAPNQLMKPTQHFVVSSIDYETDCQSAGWLISVSLGSFETMGDDRELY